MRDKCGSVEWNYSANFMTDKPEVGVIGLAVMGANLARNFASHDVPTAVFNRTTETTDHFLQNYGGANLTGYHNLPEFVAALETPRKILLMVKAGSAVDDLIAQLLPFLQAGDIVIDGGNSRWSDTLRREHELAAHDIFFFGCGVSGGEDGALHGPSLMPGGDPEIYAEKLQPLFAKIAARDFAGFPCVAWCGENGAGHYVKMVHNGIEYGLMEILAEVYDLFRKLYELPPPEIAAIFQKLQHGKLESFLLEIAQKVLRKKDEESNDYLIDKILDAAGQKNTGRWTVIDALERGIPIPSITAAVNARLISSQKVLRIVLYQGVVPHHEAPPLPVSKLTALLEDALIAAFLSVFAQGFFLLAEAAAAQKWSLDLAEMARIWQGGCIIRTRLLEFLRSAYQNSSRALGKNSHLLALPEISREVDTTSPALRQVVALGIQGGIPLPGLGSALAYLENMRQVDGNANFIQALRDYFGAHTFERTDQEGVFHADWN